MEANTPDFKGFGLEANKDEKTFFTDNHTFVVRHSC
jgi:hypothetical protein